MVTTIAGTAGIEALFFEKPVIVFSDVIYSEFSNVFRIRDKMDIPKIIRKALSLKPDRESLKKIVSLYKNECIEADLISLQHKCMRYIGNYGINELVLPTQEKLQRFIEENKEYLEMIANEHIRKMILYEKNEITHGLRKDVMRL